MHFITDGRYRLFDLKHVGLLLISERILIIIIVRVPWIHSDYHPKPPFCECFLFILQGLFFLFYLLIYFKCLSFNTLNILPFLGILFFIYMTPLNKAAALPEIINNRNNNNEVRIWWYYQSINQGNNVILNIDQILQNGCEILTLH